MSNRGENIIKKKLQDYEVPFEDKFWSDFQNREQQQIEKAQRTNGKRAKYLGLLLLLFTMGSFFFLKQDEGGTLKIVNVNKEKVILNNQSTVKNSEVNQNITINTITNRETEKGSSENVNTTENITSKNTAIASNQSQNDEKNIAFDAKNRKSKETKADNGELSGDYSSTSNAAITTNKSFVEPSFKVYTDLTDDIDPYISKSNHNIDVVALNNANNQNDVSDLIINSTEDDLELAYLDNDRDLILADLYNNEVNNNNVTNVTNVQYNSGIQDDINKHTPTKDNFIETNTSTSEVSKSWQYTHLNGLSTQLHEEMPSDDFRKKRDDIEIRKNMKDKWEVGLTAGVGLNIPVNNSETQSQIELMGRQPNWLVSAYGRYYHNRRLSFEFGLQYKSINDLFEAQMIGEDLQGNPINETTVVQRLKSFDLPMGITVRLSSWLDFNAGMTLSYVKPAAAQEYNELEVGGPLNYYTSFEDYGIKKFDARVYGGLTFNISPFVGFRFKVTQGLTDRTDDEYYGKQDYDVHTDYSFSAFFRLHLKNIK